MTKVLACGCWVTRVLACGCWVTRVLACGCWVTRVLACGCWVTRVLACGCWVIGVLVCGCWVMNVLFGMWMLGDGCVDVLQQHVGGRAGPQCRNSAGGGQEDLRPDRAAGHLSSAQHYL